MKRHGFCDGVRLAPRCHFVRRDDVDYSRADLFRERFSCERCDPKDRGRETAWHRCIKR